MVPDSSESSRPVPAGPPRVHLDTLQGAKSGAHVPIAPDQARHLVRVRRLEAGSAVEAFDDEGRAATGVLVQERGEWLVRLIAHPRPASRAQKALGVYTAIPKGNRADWMVEKLSELGASALVPLLTARSVVDPGAGKLDRFTRIARESAKQSRRSGVLVIHHPMPLPDALAHFTAAGGRGAVLTTELHGPPLASMDAQALFIGPEGGWEQAELSAIAAAGVSPARLTASILRVETAAVAGAAVLLAR